MSTSNKPTQNLPDWLLESWLQLTPLERASIAGQVFIETRKNHPLPYSLLSMTGVLTLSLFALLPTNPMLLPIALGGGLSLAILAQTARAVLFT